MNINDYILNDIKPLTLQCSVKKAKKLFDNFPITHFPVVENGKLLGSFAEVDIHSRESNSEKLEEITHLLDNFFSAGNDNVLELLKLFADYDTSIIPVLDNNQNYIGYFELRAVLDVFSASPFMEENRETLIVEKPESDYSMSQVVQIVESTGGRILGCYVSEQRNDIIQVTLKVQSVEMNELMQTFRRYDYQIVSTHKDDIYLEDLKSRSEYLKKYLEM